MTTWSRKYIACYFKEFILNSALPPIQIITMILKILCKYKHGLVFYHTLLYRNYYGLTKDHIQKHGLTEHFREPILRFYEFRLSSLYWPWAHNLNLKDLRLNIRKNILLEKLPKFSELHLYAVCNRMHKINIVYFMWL